MKTQISFQLDQNGIKAMIASITAGMEIVHEDHDANALHEIDAVLEYLRAMLAYDHEPDDGHEHEFSDEDGLPDTGTEAITVICLKCGTLSAIDPVESDDL